MDEDVESQVKQPRALSLEIPAGDDGPKLVRSSERGDLRVRSPTAESGRSYGVSSGDIFQDGNFTRASPTRENTSRSLHYWSLHATNPFWRGLYTLLAFANDQLRRLFGPGRDGYVPIFDEYDEAETAEMGGVDRVVSDQMSRQRKETEMREILEECCDRILQSLRSHGVDFGEGEAGAEEEIEEEEEKDDEVACVGPRSPKRRRGGGVAAFTENSRQLVYVSRTISELVIDGVKQRARGNAKKELQILQEVVKSLREKTEPNKVLDDAQSKKDAKTNATRVTMIRNAARFFDQMHEVTSGRDSHSMQTKYVTAMILSGEGIRPSDISAHVNLSKRVSVEGRDRRALFDAKFTSLSAMIGGNESDDSDDSHEDSSDDEGENDEGEDDEVEDEVVAAEFEETVAAKRARKAAAVAIWLEEVRPTSGSVADRELFGLGKQKRAKKKLSSHKDVSLTFLEILLGSRRKSRSSKFNGNAIRDCQHILLARPDSEISVKVPCQQLDMSIQYEFVKFWRHARLWDVYVDFLQSPFFGKFQEDNVREVVVWRDTPDGYVKTVQRVYPGISFSKFCRLLCSCSRFQGQRDCADAVTTTTTPSHPTPR